MNLSNKHKHPGFVAFALHRLSGIALAVFLPLHFFVLGRAIEGADSLERMLAITATPLIKILEVALLGALAVHFAGGVRLLLLELMGWNEHHAGWLAASLALAVFVGCALLLSARVSV